MNFIEATKLAQKGKYISNHLWAAKHYIYIPKPWQEFNNIFFDQDGDEYVFSANEILDTNWTVYPQEPKTYSFPEALKAFSNDKIIRRNTQSKNFYKVEDVITIDTLIFSYGDVIATDWLIFNAEDCLIDWEG